MKKDPFNLFDVNEFKKWMKNSHKEENSLVGMNVESKVSVKKLLCVSEFYDEENKKKIAHDFSSNGGIILEENDGKTLKIETKKGIIEIHKMYTKLS